MNGCVVEGVVRGEVVQRTLADGATVAELDVRPADGGGGVTVVVEGPGRSVLALAEGDAVLVVGSVRRRFYRAAGATRAVTEVRAEHIVRSGGRARARRLATVVDRLAAAGC